MSMNERAATGTTGMQTPARREADPSWKRELNDKIAAARARRMAEHPVTPAAPREITDSHSRASRVAAAVAARYADAPSYSEYLAAEVRAAIAAAAQVADRQARAADASNAEANPEVAASPAEPPMPAIAEARALPAPIAAAKSPARRVKPDPSPRVDHAASGFPYATQELRAQEVVQSSRTPYVPTASDLSDPIQDALVTPATPLPAKLLEFPRELIAARKARPRHAEGPLRDGLDEEPGQLRIFEVEPSAISTRAEAPPQATEWSSIRLDAYPLPEAYPTEDLDDHTGVTSGRLPSAYNRGVAQAQTQHASGQASRRSGHNFEQDPGLNLLPDVAGLPDRLMAGIVDAALVGIAFTLFVFAFAASTAHPPTGRPALIGGAVLLCFFYLLYQFLFFSFGDATPGMRYARIALCTFNDDNPTREAMRKRIFALVLAAAPLGLGFLYALFDDYGLGWHDRMTRMYQRSYK